MILHEPATFATDCVLAVWSGWLGSRLKGGDAVMNWWRRSFYWTAAAGLAGGVYHGFAPAMLPLAANLLWRLTLLAISATSFCLFLAAVFATQRGWYLQFWQRIAWVKAVVFASYAMIHPVFLSAIADYGSAMLFVFIVELIAWRSTHSLRATWIMVGVIVSIAGAMVQQTRWALTAHFNQNDLYHVIQMAALAAFYRGARMSR
jgi:hypothetical protein